MAKEDQRMDWYQCSRLNHSLQRQLWKRQPRWEGSRQKNHDSQNREIRLCRTWSDIFLHSWPWWGEVLDHPKKYKGTPGRWSHSYRLLERLYLRWSHEIHRFRGVRKWKRSKGGRKVSAAGQGVCRRGRWHHFVQVQCRKGKMIVLLDMRQCISSSDRITINILAFREGRLAYNFHHLVIK